MATPLFGTSTVSLAAAQAWARQNGAHPRFIAFAVHLWRHAPAFGIPPEVPYGQSSWETNWGKFTGVLGPEKHNWGGIKTTTGWSDTDPDHHQTFTDDEQGAIALLEHLFGYGGKKAKELPAGYELVDPRFHLITKYTDNVEGLGGAWAPSPTYGRNVAGRVASLREFASTWEQPMAAQIPGFTWYPAQPTHYTKGRTVRIRGGAQHYSGGTNSLPWLTSTSGQDDPSRRVSATFLVKRNATMADRGWQLVRIEDTPWTTAYANPYTVSTEYEHLASQDIPDGDYEVLGQTWADIENYVLAQNLGTIDVVQGHKVWVDNPDLVCPDGIDVDRVVREWQARRGGGQPVRPPDVTDPDARYIEQTRVWLQMGFKAFWESNADALRWLGYPVENERGISGGLSIQRFQRGVLIYDASQPDGWQITALPLDRYAEFGLSEALSGRAA